MTERSRFATTRWSVVLAAASEDTTDARTALADLCATYWYPLYAFARRRGSDVSVAQDQTQAFLADFIARGSVADADQDRGRFRSYLLRSFQNHCNKQHAKDRAQKRGGDLKHLSLDFDDGERRYSLEPSHDLTPERVFERRWALEVLAAALERLRDEFETSGKSEQFAVLEAYLGAGTGAPPLSETAKRLGLTPGAAKVALHRLRKRYRAALRSVIADTVRDPAEVDAELRALVDALARR